MHGRPPAGYGPPCELNHLRSVATLPDPNSAPGVEPRPAGPAIDPALEAALARCERGEAAGMHELRAWQNGRLHAMLTRMLADPDLTARALDRLLADVAQAAGTRRESGDGAEDWLFARLRRHGREIEREAGVEPRLRSVATAAAPPVATTIETPSTSLPVVADPGPGTLNPRLRRHRAPVHTPLIEEMPAAPGVRHRWPLLVGLALIAASAAGGLALLAPDWLAATRDLVQPAAAPGVVTAPSPQAAAAPPAVSPRNLLGDPIADREPPRVAIPPEHRPVPVRGTTEAAAIFAPLRIFVHHGAADPDGAVLARRLADGLRGSGAGYVEVKAVPFDVVTSSVRYFRAEDRAGRRAADRGDPARS